MKKVFTLTLILSLILSIAKPQSILISYEAIQSLPSIMKDGSFMQSLHYENIYSHSPNILLQSKHVKRFNAQIGIGAEFLTMKYSLSNDANNKVWGYSDYYSPTLNSLTTFINLPVYISYDIYKDFYASFGFVNSFLLSESKDTPWKEGIVTYQPQTKLGLKYSFKDIVDFSVFVLYALKEFAYLKNTDEYRYIWQVQNATSINLMRAATLSVSYRIPLKSKNQTKQEIHTKPVEIE